MGKILNAYVGRATAVDDKLDAWYTPRVDNIKNNSLKNGLIGISDKLNHHFKKHKVSGTALGGGLLTAAVALTGGISSHMEGIQSGLRGAQQGLRSLTGGDAMWAEGGSGFDLASALDPFMQGSAQFISNAADIVAANSCGVAAVFGVASLTVAGTWFAMHYNRKISAAKQNANPNGSNSNGIDDIFGDNIPEGAAAKHIYGKNANAEQHGDAHGEETAASAAPAKKSFKDKIKSFFGIGKKKDSVEEQNTDLDHVPAAAGVDKNTTEVATVAAQPHVGKKTTEVAVKPASTMSLSVYKLQRHSHNLNRPSIHTLSDYQKVR